MDKLVECFGQHKNYYKIKEDGDDEYHNLLKSAGDKLVIVDFSATWCGPCKMIGPVFKKIADKLPNCVLINVDVDDLETIAEDAKITVMPTFQFYKNGVKVDEFSGANEGKLKELIKKHAGVDIDNV